MLLIRQLGLFGPAARMQRPLQMQLPGNVQRSCLPLPAASPPDNSSILSDAPDSANKCVLALPPSVDARLAPEYGSANSRCGRLNFFSFFPAPKQKHVRNLHLPAIDVEGASFFVGDPTSVIPARMRPCQTATKWPRGRNFKCALPSTSTKPPAARSKTGVL
jgi:hypothetical protein